MVLAIARATRAGPPRARDRRRPIWQVALPVLLATGATAAVGLQEISKPSAWRDEAATLSAATRSPSQILHLAHNVDAVLTPYYLAMHLLLGDRPDLFLARLPSLVAMALTAGALVTLTTRLFGLRAGWFSGALFVLVPMTSRYAQEARPYAITALLAVVATWLLVRACETPRWAWFATYGVAIALLGYANLIAVLLLVAHAVTVATSRRRDVLIRWASVCAVAVISLAPLVWYGAHETFAIEGLDRPTSNTLGKLVTAFAGTASATWWLLGAVLVALAFAAWRRTRPPRRPVHTAVRPWLVVLPWLVVPTVALFAVSQVHPVFLARYLVFCLPAFAMAVGAAVSRLPWPAWAATLAIVGWLTFPAQHNIRSEAGHNEDLKNLAAFVALRAEPQDGLLYLPGRLRVIAGAYPALEYDAIDIALDRSPVASGTLEGTEVYPGLVQPYVLAHRRIWVVTTINARPITDADAAKLPALSEEYHLVWEHVYHGGFVLELYKHI